MYSVVVVAAGSGTRFSDVENKLLYKLHNGNRVIEETLSKFLVDVRCNQIVLVASEEVINYFEERQRFPEKVLFAMGGKTRQESVYNGLKAVINDKVLIHDGARPWVSNKDIDLVVDKLDECDAVCLCGRIFDTVKVVSEKTIEKTIDRNTLRRALTPQGFRYSSLFEAYKKAIDDKLETTDDCMLYELVTRKPIYYVDGESENRKITTIEDVRGK